MQNAPSVVYPVGRSALPAWSCVALGLAILSAGVLAGITMNASPRVWAALLVPGPMWAAWAWHDWRRMPDGWLHWQAQGRGTQDAPTGQWHWRSDLADGGRELRSVEPVLDLQGWWLLRLSGAGVPRWVCVEARRDPANWVALRRALTLMRRVQ